MKRIDISKEDLLKLYCEQSLTMIEIAKIYKANRTTISNKLKQFEIQSNPNQRKYETIKKTSLTQLQKEFVIGCCLGDGSLICSGRRINAYFKVDHCEEQKEYLVWCKELFGELANKINKYVDKRGNSIMYGFHTLSHHDLNYYYNMFYYNNVKFIKDEVAHHLTPFGLAVWFMDDGSKNKFNYRFNTQGFSECDNHKLKQILKTNFDLDVNVCKCTRDDKIYYYLSVNKENAIKMTEIVKPYIVDCMKYKLIDCSSTTTC